MADATVAEQLAAWAHRVYRTELPEAVVQRAATAVLDTVGCLLAGLPSQPVTAIKGLLAEERPEWTFETLPADRLALLLGTAAHAHDFDDAQLPTLVHPSAVVVPASIANLGRKPVSGAELLRAVAIGAEVAIRTGFAAVDRPSGDSVLFQRGLHMTSLCGTLGAAITTGLLRGLDIERLGHALSMSTSLASGLLEGNRVGGSIKPLHAGWAASAGTTAAALATHGLTGAPTAFEGRFGYLQAFIGSRTDGTVLTSDLDDHWHFQSTLVKPFPTNGFTHSAVELAIMLREQGVSPNQIREIELALPGPTLRTVAEPAEVKVAPPSGYAARFSAPFAVAVALRGGGGLGVALEDFTDAVVRDPETLALAAAVRCREGARESALFPDHLACTASVTLHDGSVRSLSLDDSLGSPARPLSPDQLSGKFRTNAAGYRTTAIDQLEALLFDIERQPDATQLPTALFLAVEG